MKTISEELFEYARDVNDLPMLSAPNNQNNIADHFHRQMEILYVTQGHVQVKINDVTKILCKDQVAISDVMIFDNLPFRRIAIDKPFVFIRFSRCFEIHKMSDIIRITQDFIHGTSVPEIRTGGIVPIHISALFQIKCLWGVVTFFGKYFRYRKRIITVDA